MKKIFLLPLLSLSAFTHAQSNVELKSEIDNIKSEIKSLTTVVQKVTTQNNYLRRTLDLNKPILENKSNNVVYQITKVEGSIKNKTIFMDILIETTERDRNYNLTDFLMVDLNGNTYDIDYVKSSSAYPKLTNDVPIKFTATFNNIPLDVAFIKLLKFSMRITPESFSPNLIRSSLEFRDLHVSWK